MHKGVRAFCEVSRVRSQVLGEALREALPGRRAGCQRAKFGGSGPSASSSSACTGEREDIEWAGMSRYTLPSSSMTDWEG